MAWKVSLLHLHTETCSRPLHSAHIEHITNSVLEAEPGAAVYCHTKGEGQGLWCSGKEGGEWIHCSISFHNMNEQSI